MRKPRLANKRDAGAQCRLCPNKVRAGEPIVSIRVRLSELSVADAYMHTACMHAVADRAPEAKVFPTATAAQYAKLRRDLARKGAAAIP